MSDKKELPQFVEDWIAQTTVTMQLNPKYSGVLEEDLRAFLAQYVLCEREPVAVMREWPNAVCLDFMVDNIGIHTPLHAPAKEKP